MKKMKNVFVVFMGVFLIMNLLSAQGISSSERNEFENEFKNTYGKKCKIIWDNNSGTVNRIWGEKITIKSSDTPENISKLFLNENKRIFGIKDVENDFIGGFA